MSRYKIQGYIDGIIAAVSYGTNPLFFLSLHKLGLSVNSVLFYRYLFAVIIYGLWLKIFREASLKISLKDCLLLIFMGIVFAMTSVTLFESFRYLDSGIACTILFVYPVITALISGIIFKDKINKTTIFSMFITIGGIFLLNYSGDTTLNIKGVIFVLLSALIYAIYIVLIKHLKPLHHIKYDVLSFYVMFFGLIVFIYNLDFCTQLQPLTSWKMYIYTFALAIFPTIISIETINVAIRLIGSTTTAVLGALEPITAIFIGVIVFKEILTIKSILGIVMVLSGVILIILRDNFKMAKINKTHL